MRKVIFVLCLAALISGCNHDQSRAEKLVSTYLKENLKDPDSYQNIEMSDISQLTWVGLFLQEDLKKVKAKELSSDGFGERTAIFRENMKAKGMDPDSVIAYTMKHRYRAKNSFGGYATRAVEYTFDNEIKSIIGIDDIE